MSKIKKINLDTNELNSLIKSLRILSDNLKKIPDDISYEIAKQGEEFLDNQYKSTHTDHTIDINSINTMITRKQNGYSIIAYGEELLYAEFGTGEEGADNPHPLKSNFNLNPYNSGPIVSTHINKNGRHYWFYQNEYSEGNPSGKQLFNTCNYLRKNVVKKVMKEKVGEVISKV